MSYVINVRLQTSSSKDSHHPEPSHMIRIADQLTGIYTIQALTGRCSKADFNNDLFVRNLDFLREEILIYISRNFHSILWISRNTKINYFNSSILVITAMFFTIKIFNQLFLFKVP